MILHWWLNGGVIIAVTIVQRVAIRECVLISVVILFCRRIEISLSIGQLGHHSWLGLGSIVVCGIHGACAASNTGFSTTTCPVHVGTTGESISREVNGRHNGIVELSSGSQQICESFREKGLSSSRETVCALTTVRARVFIRGGSPRETVVGDRQTRRPSNLKTSCATASTLDRMKSEAVVAQSCGSGEFLENSRHYDLCGHCPKAKSEKPTNNAAMYLSPFGTSRRTSQSPLGARDTSYTY